MSDELKILLEKIENANPRNRPSAATHKEDLKELIAPDLTENFIKMAYQSDLIRDADDLLRQNKPNININSTVYILSIKGFEYLNQIRIKKAIEDFSESSDKYSKELVDLTRAIYIFTVIVVGLPIYEKILQGKILEAIFLFIAVVIVAKLLMYSKDHKKKKS